MPDLHAWITQQIEEAEHLARRAAGLCGCHPPAPSWSFRDGDEPTDGRILIIDEPHPTLKRKIGRKWNGSYEGLFMAEHIVRHDPEAVLRRCAADRKILARHRPDPDVHFEPACLGCRTYGDTALSWTDNLNECPELLDLAEAHGLTPGVLATLDQPVPPTRPERPASAGSSLLPDGLAEAMYGNLYAAFLGTRPVEPRPEVKAMEILAPELKKIPGYVPTTNPEA